MKKRVRKYKSFALFVFVAVVITGIYGYREYTRKLPETKNLKSAFNLKSADLIRDFEVNESKATAQYSDKVISVQGVVSSVQLTDSSGMVFLNDGSSMTSVLCQFDWKNIPAILELQKGRPVTIKGVCSGYLMDVVMVRCVLEQ